MNNNGFITITIPTATLVEPLKAPIMKEVLEALIKINTESLEKKDEEFLTRKQTAKTLLISLPTLKKMYSSGVIKAYRIGNSLRFKRSDVIACVTQVKTALYSRKSNY